MAFEHYAKIEAPADEVWRRLCESGPASEGGGTAEAGAVTAGARLLTGRGARVVAAEPPRLLTLRRVEGPFVATHRFDLLDQRDGTLVTLRADCVASSGAARLLAPLLRYLIGRADRRRLAGLSRALRAAAP